MIVSRGTICDPRVNTGCVLRCPIVDGIDPCMQKSENWPSSADVEDAEDCGNSQLCLDLFNGYRLRIHLHNTVSA